jgi:predicted phosphodiesterase
MQVAVISDVHGNLVALEAVLANLEANHINEMVCLGDVAALGPQPCEVIGRLRKIDCPIAMGNTDAGLLNPNPHQFRGESTYRIEDIELWVAKQLAPPDLDYLSTFQQTVEVPLSSDMHLLCFHGSPRSCTDRILATTPEDELEGMLSGYQTTVMAGGHTHTPMLRCFKETTIINPGTVGHFTGFTSLIGQAPYPPRAEYAVVGLEKGELSIEFRRVPFDVDRLIEIALETDMPHLGWWIKNWRIQ